MNTSPYRVETVLVDIRKPKICQTIAVVASTDVQIELTVLANGSAYNCTGLNSKLYISKNGQAADFDAEFVGRGKIVFTIPKDSITEAGEYEWQVCVDDGILLSEWARGAFVIRVNPSAEFVPMELPDPPFPKKADIAALGELAADSTQKQIRAYIKALYAILSGAN